VTGGSGAGAWAAARKVWVVSDTRISVAVLFGGRSGEHAVSCLSAASVLAELDRSRFDVTAIGITRDGQWRHFDAAAIPLRDGDTMPEVTSYATSARVLVRLDTASSALTFPATAAALDVDVVFPLLHGPYGEDGTVQGLLELADLPYVGPGVLASAAAMDKEFTKRLLSSAGLAVTPSVVLHGDTDCLTADDRRRLGLPVFVKPARAGSSLGVTKVGQWAALDDAVVTARRHDAKVLVEAAVTGRELECGVLEFPDGRVAASPPAEIEVCNGRFYDFAAKYVDDVTRFDLPAALPEAVTERVREQAVAAFRALGAQVLARVDFFVADDGSVTVNEVNTMPGFTPISMYPRMWLAAGLSYPQLLTTLVDTALARGTGLR
jgi:D-alanine-D-alanine ligase